MPIDGAARSTAAARMDRLLRYAAVAVVVATFGWKLLLLLREFAWAIHYPYGLDYGEGIVWEQMRQMLAGKAYGPIDQFPAIVFHYPPVYHLTVAAFAATGLDGLAAGRLVSCASGLTAALLAGFLGSRLVADKARSAQWTCGLVAAGFTFSSAPFALWAHLMRVDMLALALAFAGLACMTGALRRPILAHLASFFFVAALFTKQTMIAAPAAAYLTLLIARPRLAIASLGSALLMGGVTLVVLSALTDGGVIRHLFLYNVNRFAPARLGLVPRSMLLQGLLVALALIGVALAWLARLAAARGAPKTFASFQEALGTPAGFATFACTAYLAAATPMLVLIAKVGSSVNYLLEFYAILSIFAGVAVATLLAEDGPARPGSLARRLALVAIPAYVAFQVLRLPDAQGGPYPHAPHDAAEMRELIALIRHADRPVISDDMVAVIRAGRPVVWEPAIFAELASTGVYDESQVVRMIQERRFGFFVTDFNFGHPLFEARYRPAIAAAMAQNYPVQRELAGEVLHLPPAKPSAR